MRDVDDHQEMNDNNNINNKRRSISAQEQQQQQQDPYNRNHHPRSSLTSSKKRKSGDNSNDPKNDMSFSPAWVSMQQSLQLLTPALPPFLSRDERYKLLRPHLAPQYILLHELDRGEYDFCVPVEKQLLVLVHSVESHYHTIWTVTLQDESGALVKAWIDPDFVQQQIQNPEDSCLRPGVVWLLTSGLSLSVAPNADEPDCKLERILLVQGSSVAQVWRPEHATNNSNNNDTELSSRERRDYLRWVERRKMITHQVMQAFQPSDDDDEEGDDDDAEPPAEYEMEVEDHTLVPRKLDKTKPSTPIIQVGTTSHSNIGATDRISGNGATAENNNNNWDQLLGGAGAPSTTANATPARPPSDQPAKVIPRPVLQSQQNNSFFRTPVTSQRGGSSITDETPTQVPGSSTSIIPGNNSIMDSLEKSTPNTQQTNSFRLPSLDTAASTSLTADDAFNTQGMNNVVTAVATNNPYARNMTKQQRIITATAASSTMSKLQLSTSTLSGSFGTQQQQKQTDTMSIMSQSQQNHPYNDNHISQQQHKQLNHDTTQESNSFLLPSATATASSLPSQFQSQACSLNTQQQLQQQRTAQSTVMMTKQPPPASRQRTTTSSQSTAPTQKPNISPRRPSLDKFANRPTSNKTTTAFGARLEQFANRPSGKTAATASPMREETASLPKSQKQTSPKASGGSSTKKKKRQAASTPKSSKKSKKATSKSPASVSSPNPTSTLWDTTPDESVLDQLLVEDDDEIENIAIGESTSKTTTMDDENPTKPLAVPPKENRPVPSEEDEVGGSQEILTQNAEGKTKSLFDVTNFEDFDFDALGDD
jgi:hypothetical protein